jgi:hypothetical protein
VTRFNHRADFFLINAQLLCLIYMVGESGLAVGLTDAPMAISTFVRSSILVTFLSRLSLTMLWLTLPRKSSVT